MHLHARRCAMLLALCSCNMLNIYTDTTAMTTLLSQDFDRGYDVVLRVQSLGMMSVKERQRKTGNLTDKVNQLNFILSLISCKRDISQRASMRSVVCTRRASCFC
jgi:hypothetical protein